jgi:hypothetical protein
MAAIVAEILLFSLLIGAVLITSAVSLLIKLLRGVGSFIMETVKPEVERLWEEHKRRQLEARKPADIQAAAKDAQFTVERVLADYRKETDEILQTPKKVIFIDHNNR